MERDMAFLEESARRLLQKTRELSEELKSQRIFREGEYRQMAEALVQSEIQKVLLAMERGRSSLFRGGAQVEREREFAEWAKEAESHILSIHSRLKPVLDWATEQEEPITDETLQKEFTGADVEWKRWRPGVVTQAFEVYAMLGHLSDGSIDDIIYNSDRNGIESWRQLHRQRAPVTGGRVRNLLRVIISPGRCSMVELPRGLENWEEMVDRYEKSVDRD